MLERRVFVAWLITAIAGVIGAVVGIPLAGYTILPAFRRPPETWTDAGPVEKLFPGKPQELKVFQTITDGWRKAKVSKSVWAVKQVSGEVVVFSGLCTHLGCGFRWNDQAGQFQCPCHTGIFAPDGRVLGGPPPRPLDRLPAKIEGERLLVIYKEFKAGSAAKIEL